MKIVINRCFGGFSLSQSAVKSLGLRSAYDDINRDDARLINLVEENAEAASGRCAKLAVIEIPDSATDWEITDYDGAEGIIYVVDGHLYHA